MILENLQKYIKSEKYAPANSTTAYACKKQPLEFMLVIL